MAEVTHRCPTADHGGGLTPCCNKTPFELPRTDRITNDPNLVTCGGCLTVRVNKRSVTAEPGTRSERGRLIAEAVEPFRLLLIWLDRGRPRKLCIDGRAYTRRQRARRRRGRR